MSSLDKDMMYITVLSQNCKIDGSCAAILSKDFGDGQFQIFRWTRHL